MADATEADATERRVMLVQQGARRNYVYARQLEDAGLLRRLVTDAAWSEAAPNRLAALLNRVPFLHKPGLDGAIARRTVRGVPVERLRASVWPNLMAAMVSRLHEERAYPLIDEALAWRCRWRGLDGCDVVVNYHGNGGSFLDYAKARGARIVTDFIITPKYLEIEQAERERWPGWEAQSTPRAVIDLYRRRMSRLVRISDLYLCPSPTVARDLADLPGFDPARVRLVPYGSSAVLVREPRPKLGRVLFAGAAGLRKGLPYLAQAATLLKAQAPAPNIEFVVAGHASETIRRRPEIRDLTFLGVLDREAMAAEMARADVFCLPSLAEGSATSIFEAIANGLPVVTTASSGSLVTDGVEGRIVPERDGAAIAAAIAQIVGDRAQRRVMSEAALAASARYSDEACGERFIAVIRELTTAPIAKPDGRAVPSRRPNRSEASPCM